MRVMQIVLVVGLNFIIANSLLGDPKDLRFISIIGTNDIHGGIEPSTPHGGGKKIGGLEILAAALDAIRTGVEKKGQGGVAVADAGDQFQGTLLSNHDEGMLVFRILKILKYAAVIPGNHNFDFGPTGWLEDKVNPGNPDKDKRGALRKLIAEVKDTFPLISANTYVSSTLKDGKGTDLLIDAANCQPVDAEGNPIKAQIDWSKAEHPDFLETHKIVEVGKTGVRVAFIGLDNTLTKAMTTADNVDDLCFRSLSDTYLELRKKLEGKADIFIAVTHEGDVKPLMGKKGKVLRKGSTAASDLFKKLAQMDPPVLDGVIAGHTHNMNEVDLTDGAKAGPVPFIQSYSGGQFIGRMDFVWDAKAQKLLREKTTFVAAVPLSSDHCDPRAKFCTLVDGKVAYDGVLLKDATQEPVKSVHELIELAKTNQDYDRRTKIVLGTTPGTLYVDRYNEDSLPDVLNDLLLELTRTKVREKYKNAAPEIHVAMMNASGIRRSIPKGEVGYPLFFEVLPFNNHGVVVGPMAIKTLVELFKVNVTSCGDFGALMQSGLRITFDRDCTREVGQLDRKAELVKIELAQPSKTLPQVLYEQGRAPVEGIVNIATMDFIAEGGERFKDQFSRTKTKIRDILDMGPVRELLVEEWMKNPPRIELNEHGAVKSDERYKQLHPEPREE